jgi:predicted RNA-binding protein with PUA-like domain
MNYWLIKTEADCYSIDDLKRDGKTPWAGVRNFQARNFMRDHMKVGDLALFYHSSSTDKDKPNGVYGIAKVASAPYVDETAFDKKDEHYDAVLDKKRIEAQKKKLKFEPTWMLVDFAFKKKFSHPFTLAEIKIDPKLDGMIVRQRGSRLSIQPVSEKHFNYIVTNRQ